MPAVASDGRPSADTSSPRSGAATSVSGPLSSTTQPNRSDASRTASRRCAAISADVAAEQTGELALVRREHARRRPVARLELEERVRVDDDGQLGLGEHAPHELLRPGTAAEPGPDRDRAGLLRELEHDIGCRLRDDAVRLRQRSLDGLEQALLQHGQRRLGYRHGDVAGVRTHRGERGELRCAGEPARAADDEHVPGRVLVVGLAPSRHAAERCSAPTSRLLRLRVREPDVGDEHDAGVEAPGATTTPSLRPWNVTVASARTAAPATSPVDASTPDGRSTATHVRGRRR